MIENQNERELLSKLEKSKAEVGVVVTILKTEQEKKLKNITRCATTDDLLRLQGECFCMEEVIRYFSSISTRLRLLDKLESSINN